MKAGILYADRDIRLGEAPDPRIRPDELLLETHYAGICGTDIHIFRGENLGSYPVIPGHEFAGVVRLWWATPASSLCSPRSIVNCN